MAWQRGVLEYFDRGTVASGKASSARGYLVAHELVFPADRSQLARPVGSAECFHGTLPYRFQPSSLSPPRILVPTSLGFQWGYTCKAYGCTHVPIAVGTPNLATAEHGGAMVTRRDEQENSVAISQRAP